MTVGDGIFGGIEKRENKLKKIVLGLVLMSVISNIAKAETCSSRLRKEAVGCGVVGVATVGAVVGIVPLIMCYEYTKFANLLKDAHILANEKINKSTDKKKREKKAEKNLEKYYADLVKHKPGMLLTDDDVITILDDIYTNGVEQGTCNIVPFLHDENYGYYYYRLKDAYRNLLANDQIRAKQYADAARYRNENSRKNKKSPTDTSIGEDLSTLELPKPNGSDVGDSTKKRIKRKKITRHTKNLENESFQPEKSQDSDNLISEQSTQFTNSVFGLSKPRNLKD